MSREKFTGGFEDRSGKLHESFLLGEVRKDDPKYQERLKSLGVDQRGYLPFWLAVELVMEFQPLVKVKNPFTRQEQVEKQDPTNPGKLFPKDLRLAVADKLGFEKDEDLDRLEYYTAVGSPLDTFHGVDFFIILKRKIERDTRQIVTFDVTLRTEASAKSEARANVIIRELNAEDTKKYLKEVDEIAAQAAPYLRK